MRFRVVHISYSRYIALKAIFTFPQHYNSFILESLYNRERPKKRHPTIAASRRNLRKTFSAGSLVYFPQYQ